MRRALVLLALGVGVVAAAPQAASAANECRGLLVCVPVAGPWVVVPAGRGADRPRVEYQLQCPRGYIVGGLDAVLSDRAIDVGFLGALGSPVNPGITTSREAVFFATYTGPRPRVTTFRPHIGCMPASGGGRRPTAAGAFRPGRPTVRRVWTLRARAQRTQQAVYRCARGERLVGAAHAVGIYTPRPPASRVAASVVARHSARGGRVAVVVRAGAALGAVRAVVQVHAICATGTP